MDDSYLRMENFGIEDWHETETAPDDNTFTWPGKLDRMPISPGPCWTESQNMVPQDYGHVVGDCSLDGREMANSPECIGSIHSEAFYVSPSDILLPAPSSGLFHNQPGSNTTTYPQEAASTNFGGAVATMDDFGTSPLAHSQSKNDPNGRRRNTREKRKKERPEKCDICGMGHQWVRDLKRHYNIHHSEYAEILGCYTPRLRCRYRYCDKSCSRKDHLTRHLQRKHGR